MGQQGQHHLSKLQQILLPLQPLLPPELVRLMMLAVLPTAVLAPQWQELAVRAHPEHQA